MKENKYLLLIFIVFITVSCSVQTPEEKQVENHVCKVSLVPSVTDVLGEICADEVVAVSWFCDASFITDSLPRVSTFPQINYEKLLEYKECEIVVLEGFINVDQVNRLNELGFNLLSVKDKTIQDLIQIPFVLDSIKGKELSDKLQSDFNNLLKKRIEGSPSYLIMLGHNQLQVYGSGNYLTELFDTLGFVNNASNVDGAYPELKSEYFLENLPDFMITPDSVRLKQYLSARFPRQANTLIYESVRFVEIDQNVLFRPNHHFLECGKALLMKYEVKM